MIALTIYVVTLAYDSTALRLHDKCTFFYTASTDEDRPSWLGKENALGNIKFPSVHFPSTLTDLQQIISSAETGSLLPTGTGHDVSSTAMPLPGAKALNMWNFKNLSINVCKKEMTVGAGVTTRNAAEKIQELAKGRLGKYVLPTYLMIKDITLVGMMQTGVVGVGLSQRKMSFWNWVTELKVMNGLGEAKTISVKNDPNAASFWLASIGSAGVVYEVTFHLVPDTYVVHRILKGNGVGYQKDENGNVKKWLSNREIYKGLKHKEGVVTLIEEGELLTSDESVEFATCMSSEFCPFFNQITTVLDRPQEYNGDQSLINVAPVNANEERPFLWMDQLQLPAYKTPTRAALDAHIKNTVERGLHGLIGRALGLSKIGFNQTKEVRLASRDHVTPAVWDLKEPHKLQPKWMAIYVLPKDFYEAMDAIEEVHDKATVTLHSPVAIMNHKQDVFPFHILLGHHDNTIEILIEIYSDKREQIDLGTYFNALCIDVYKKLVCEKKFNIRWHLGDHFPKDLMAAKESTWPIYENLQIFRSIDLAEDPQDKFTSVALHHLYKRLDDPVSICGSDTIQLLTLPSNM